MNENLHIDEAVRQEVGTGDFPYQEAHWEALAGQLPGKKRVLFGWLWAFGAILLLGLGLGLWQVSQKANLTREISFVMPITSEMVIGNPKIVFVPLKPESSPLSFIIQKEEPAKLLSQDTAPTHASLSLLPPVKTQTQKIQIDSTVAPSLELAINSVPRGIKLRACPTCKDPRNRSWSLHVWTAPVSSEAFIIDDFSNPNSTLLVRLLDSLEGSRLGMSYGIQIQKKLSKRLGLNLGVNWAGMGYDFKDNLTFFPPTPGAPTRVRYTYSHTYVQAELGANFLIKKQRPALYGSLSLAPSWMVDFRRKRTLYYEDKDPEVKIDDFSFAEFRSFNLYGKAGVGLMWPGNAKVNVMLEPSFTHGFIPIAQNAGFNRSLWGWQVRTGIVINL